MRAAAGISCAVDRARLRPLVKEMAPTVHQQDPARTDFADVSAAGSERPVADDVVRPGVTVVVPALDEEASVLTTLDALDGALGRCGHPYEIIVVDDGSRDR